MDFLYHVFISKQCPIVLHMAFQLVFTSPKCNYDNLHQNRIKSLTNKQKKNIFFLVAFTKNKTQCSKHLTEMHKVWHTNYFGKDSDFDMESENISDRH